MAYCALALAFFALLIGLAALLSAKGACSSLDSGFRDLRRGVRNLDEELEHQLAVIRKLMARRIAGDLVTSEMVLEGRLWRDLSDSDGQRLIRDEKDLVVVDVRTYHEIESGGKLPGARTIPLDELEERISEIPSALKVLVYCAAGARSAEACEHLSRNGFDELYNLETGFSGWSGPVEKEPS
ncbi:MAG: rhodanese-related sulfurtransferase [Chlamydiales bacterium]|jgi:rhodanese-related sulfurtransferase